MGSVKRAILRCCRKRPLRREEKGGQHHRQCHYRQHHVADQDAQVYRPHRPESGKMRLSMQRMIGDVADQKERRENKRDHHRHAMGRNIPPANKVKPGQQRDRAQPVEQRIECRQKAQPGDRSIQRMMQIKQPKQKANRSRTHGDDQCDRERNRRPLVGFRY